MSDEHVPPQGSKQTITVAVEITNESGDTIRVERGAAGGVHERLPIVMRRVQAEVIGAVEAGRVDERALASVLPGSD